MTVDAVLPGPTRSAGVESVLRNRSAHLEASLAELEKAFFASARSASIIQRFLEADEIANLVASLASPRASATDGAALRDEGGLVNTIN